MKNFIRVALLATFASTVVVAACSSSGTGSTSTGTGTSGATGGSGGGTGDPVAIARGKYLVDNLLVCGECHTPVDANGKPDKSKYLAGSRSYDFKTMTNEIVSVYAENLTSDKVEGIGEWSDDWIRGSITRGLDDVQVPLWPIMPYPEYALMTSQDVNAIVAYLRTVAPSKNVVPPDTFPNPGSPAAAVNGSKIPHTTLPKTDPDFAAAERGRYLASIACVNCHTPELAPGLPDFTKPFAGGRTYRSRSDVGFSTSTNLTPDATGLAGWTVADIVESIKTNTEKGTKRALCDTMPGGPGRMGDLADGDLTDIATYLHTIAPIASQAYQCGMDPDAGAPDGG
jgi:mono/diheme cytochrome c family protein